MAAEETSNDTREAIMEATYRALSEHGYAALTMQDIADEFEKSKSLLHYHFETKDDLLVAFIEYLLTWFEREVETLEGSPDERLTAFVDRFVTPLDEDKHEMFHLALLELRAQAPFNDRYQEQFRRSENVVRGKIADIIRDGIEEGVFQEEVDSESVARLILAAIDGARIRQITLGEDGYAAAVRESLYEHVLEDIQYQGAE